MDLLEVQSLISDSLKISQSKKRSIPGYRQEVWGSSTDEQNDCLALKGGSSRKKTHQYDSQSWEAD